MLRDTIVYMGRESPANQTKLTSNAMKTFISKITKALHVHIHNKPLVSQYISFFTRDIIYECRCGHRVVKTVTKSFGEDFPIPTTTLITTKEMERILNGENPNDMTIRP